MIDLVYDVIVIILKKFLHVLVDSLVILNGIETVAYDGKNQVHQEESSIED